MGNTTVSDAGRNPSGLQTLNDLRSSIQPKPPTIERVWKRLIRQANTARDEGTAQHHYEGSLLVGEVMDEGPFRKPVSNATVRRILNDDLVNRCQY